MTVLVAMSGLPGVGKSTFATGIASALRICTIEIDRIEGPLLRQGIDGDSIGWATYEALTSIAEQQLANGVSIILDSVAWTSRIRAEWANLAKRFGAEYRPIEVVCTDISVWRARVERRHREDPANPPWNRVEYVCETYWEPWQDERLVLDSCADQAAALASAIAHVEGALNESRDTNPRP